MVLGLLAAVVLASGSLVKAIAMIVLGLLLGIVGTDVNSGLPRFSFGIPELSDGIGFVVVAMGLFGFAEIIVNLEHTEKREVFTNRVSGLWMKWKDIKEAVPAMLRGTATRLGAGHPARRRRAARGVRLLHAGKEARQGSVALRQGRDRGRRRAREPRTTPARRRRSSRC